MTLDGVLSVLEGYLCEGQNHVVATPNPEAVMEAGRNPVFMQALNAADLSLPDGVGIVMASRILKCPVPCRLGGYDTTMKFFDKIKHMGKSVYLLGAGPGVAKAAGCAIEAKFPGLTVAGARDGYFNTNEELSIIAEINALQPDILLLGMGMVKQTLWAINNKAMINVRLTLCLGGSIDVMAGKVKRPPLFMRRIGLEWLGRLIIQPSRAKRMLDLPRFTIKVLRKRFEK